MAAAERSFRHGREHAGRLRRFLLWGLALLPGWATLAYLLLPAAVERWERDDPHARPAMATQTGIGLPGDPINVGVIGSGAQLLAAMENAGWFRADPITLRSSIGIVDSILFNRFDPHAPVSPLFFAGRREDVAFEKPVGRSADRRQHVRFWCRERERGTPPIWLGSASLDSGVGVSHYTLALTHAIDPHVDAARDKLAGDITRTSAVARAYPMPGIGPTLNGRNGEGDRYVTDGEIRVVVLRDASAVQGCTLPPRS